MKRLFFGAALALTGLLAGCNKDKDVPCVVNNDTLADFTRRHSPAVQTFTIDPNRSQILTSAGGAMIYIGPNAFVRPDASLPTGSVRLLFQELYDPGAMLLANMPTVAHYTTPLESGGEFNVRVLEGNTRLHLNPGAWFTVQSPVPGRVSSDSVQMWQWVREVPPGQPDSARWTLRLDSITRRPIPVWRRDSTVSTYIVTNWPDTLGWLNCDAYWPSPAPRVNVAVAVPGDMGPGTRIFLVPAAINGVFRPYWEPGQTIAGQAGIPTGEELTAVILRIKDGRYYFGTQRAPAQQGFVYRPALREVSEDELVRLVKAL